MASTNEPPSTPLVPASPDPEAALAALRDQNVPPPPPSGADPRAQEEYAFVVDRTLPDGTKQPARFRNKILSIQQRLDIGLLQARLTLNTPWTALDPETQYLVGVIAHLTYSFVEKPQWFKASEMRDVAFMFAVYEEVARHESYFRGQRTPEAPGGSTA